MKVSMALGMIVVVVVGFLTACSSIGTREVNFYAWQQYEIIQIEIEQIVLDPKTPSKVKIRLKDVDRQAVKALTRFEQGLDTYEILKQGLREQILRFYAITGKEVDNGILALGN